MTLANGTRILTTCWINETVLFLGMKNNGDTVQYSGLYSGILSTGTSFMTPSSQYAATSTSDGAFLGSTEMEGSSRSYSDWDILARDGTVGGPFATIKLHAEISLDGQSCNY